MNTIHRVTMLLMSTRTAGTLVLVETAAFFASQATLLARSRVDSARRRQVLLDVATAMNGVALLASVVLSVSIVLIFSAMGANQ